MVKRFQGRREGMKEAPTNLDILIGMCNVLQYKIEKGDKEEALKTLKELKNFLLERPVL